VCANFLPLRNCLILILICWSAASFGQIGGRTVFNNLNIFGSARLASLGGSPIASRDGDVHLFASNPALLDSSTTRKVALSYVDYFAGANMGFAAYAFDAGSRKWTFGASMQYINYGMQDRLDALGNASGSFTAGDYNLTLSAAKPIDSLWTIGASFKTIYSSLDTYYSVANAVDLGATYYKKKSRFILAFTMRNLGYQWRAYTDKNHYKLPFEFQISASKRPRHAPFRFYLSVDNLQQFDLYFKSGAEQVVTDPVTGNIIEKKIRFPFADKMMRHAVIGTEFIITENFQIRIGYNYRRRQELKLPDRSGTAGFSYGFGFKVKRFYFAYGRAIYHAAGPANHLSISTDLRMW
jgi:hypothetical protein